jgi:hypothetical protein
LGAFLRRPKISRKPLYPLRQTGRLGLSSLPAESAHEALTHLVENLHHGRGLYIRETLIMDSDNPGEKGISCHSGKRGKAGTKVLRSHGLRLALAC